MAPPWQWKRAGTDRHALDNVTIEPASRTPKPKRWLNSKPTPFMVHSNRRLASKRELRLDVNTVKCWMSLHVNDGLARKRNDMNAPSRRWKVSFWFHLLGFQSESEYASSFRCGCRSSRMRFRAFTVQVGGGLFCQVETSFFYRVHISFFLLRSCTTQVSSEPFSTFQENFSVKWRPPFIS